MDVDQERARLILHRCPDLGRQEAGGIQLARPCRYTLLDRHEDRGDDLDMLRLFDPSTLLDFATLHVVLDPVDLRKIGEGQAGRDFFLDVRADQFVLPTLALIAPFDFRAQLPDHVIEDIDDREFPGRSFSAALPNREGRVLVDLDLEIAPGDSCHLRHLFRVHDVASRRDLTPSREKPKPLGRVRDFAGHDSLPDNKKGPQTCEPL